jgi:RND superfamily putative drug exporter
VTHGLLARFASFLTPHLVRWRWAVVLGWTVAIVIATCALGGLDGLAKDDDGARNSSSAHAHAILRDKLGINALAELGIIYEGVAPAAYRKTLDEDFARDEAVTSVRELPLPAHRGDIAMDRISVVGGLDDSASVWLATRLKAKLATHTPPAGVKVHLVGRPVLMLEIKDLNSSEVKRVERVSLGISFVVLVVVFGSFASALVPVAMGLAGITLTLGVLVALGGIVPVGGLTRLVTSVIGIAVGIDYALFVVSRYREERAAGLPPEAAVQETLAHTGGAIGVSALVMGVSILALAMPDFTGSKSIAGAVAIVLCISLLTTFTLLPALLVLADRWVASDRARERERLRSSGTWSKLARGVLSHHRWVLMGTGLVLSALVLQVGHMRLWEPGPTLLPPSLSSRQGYDALARAGLAGELDSLFVVIHQVPGPHTLAPATLEVMASAKAQLLADPRVSKVDSLLDLVKDGDAQQRDALFLGLDGPIGKWMLLPRLKHVLAADETGTYTVMRVAPREGLTSPSLRELVIDIQRKILPGLSRANGLKVDLGGNAARRVDFTTEVYSMLPAMILLVVSAIYGVLLAYFRSVLLPLKAIAMNALPVLGATGVLVLVFQDGWGAHLIGLDAAPGAVMAMTPIVVFCLVFGLSMDYEVLILSRIQEAHLRGLDNDAAIHAGMSSTGAIISGAAAIMLSVFVPNMFSQMINAKELGLGLSTAVILDATAIRLLLVPAFMKALGRWNWYFPGAQKVPAAAQAIPRGLPED